MLSQIGVCFSLIDLEIPEHRNEGESPQEYVRRLALEKAITGYEKIEQGDQRPVLGADTTVVLGDRILGKPENRDDAIDMLLALSGKTHQVMTGVALAGQTHSVSVNITEVSFSILNRVAIENYCDSTEPYDKAGAYAIQGLAAVFIESIKGSYSGVMGLPLFETAQLLQDAGIPIWHIGRSVNE